MFFVEKVGCALLKKEALYLRYLKIMVWSLLLLVPFSLPAMASPGVDLAAGYYNGYQTIRGQIKLDYNGF